MAIGPTSSRSTQMMIADNLLRSIQRTQHEMFKAQQAITTGKIYNRPSDGSAKTSSILYLREQIAARAQYNENIQNAHAVLDNADRALGDATDILLEANSIASSQVGVGSDDDTRALQASVVDAEIAALLSIANRQFNNLSLFGGNDGATADGLVFEDFLGGIRYLGSRNNLQADVGTVSTQTFTSNGLAAFGALSSRVISLVDLQVQASSETRLSEIDGAQKLGVRRGWIVVSINGTQVTVDLNTVDSLGDVVTRVNDAIDSVDNTAGGLAVASTGFEITANAGNTIQIQEFGPGQTAGDLGILFSATSATVSGPTVNRRLTETTALADLATSVDWTSGLSITQGAITKTVDFSSASTIQDLFNEINGLELGLRMEINATTTGLDMVSEVSGLRLAMGENGGTTAEDLGLHTLGSATNLADFRDGLGIEPVLGEDDFTIGLHDGTSFSIDATGLSTVGELITAVQTAATAAGLTVGVDFSMALKSVGTGLVFTDNTVGVSDFRIDNTGLSLVAEQLGLVANAQGGSTITSADRSTVRVENVFTHLMDLRDSLTISNSIGIALAGEKVEEDIDAVILARASVGTEAAKVEQIRQRSLDLEITEKAMLSEIQDADLTEVITKFTLLQTQLTASLQVGAQNLQLSLLDFLR